MGIVQNIKETWEAVKTARENKRNLDYLVDLLANSKANNSEPSFFDMSRTPGILSTGSAVFGVTDESVSPQDIYDMIHKDPYFAGLFEQLVESLFNKGFYIQQAKDKNGNVLGSSRKAKYYEAQLKDIGFTSMMEKNVYAKRADGGGNGLFFTVKKPRGFEFKFEPFLDLGKPRVKVYGNDKTRTITSYDVIDETQGVVYHIDPKTMYYRHSRYIQAGDYRFSSGPAKRAVYWFVLKKYLAGANLASYKNGLQKPVIASPNYDALTALVNAMASDKVGGQSKADYLKDPIKFLAKQSELDDEILREITGDARNTNALLKLKMPYNFQVIDRSNKDMQTIELINLCDEQMGYALRTSKGVLNTKDSKYANAEIEKDNWSNLVLDAEKRACEELAMEFFLPVLDPEYDPEVYIPRVGRDPDQEDLEVWNAKTARNESIGKNLQIAVNLPDYDFDPILNEWIKREQPNEFLSQPQAGATPEKPTEPKPEEPPSEKNQKQQNETEADQVINEDNDQSQRHARTCSCQDCSKKKYTLTASQSSEADFVRDLYQRSGLENYAPYVGVLLSPDYQREIREDFANKKIKKTDYQRFYNLLETCSETQIKKYVEKLRAKDTLEEAITSLDDDLPSLAACGLPVATLKQQLLKFARSGIEEFEETDGTKVLTRAESDFQYPTDVLDLIDAKSQLLLKGYDSLSKEQKALIDRYFGNYKTYRGLDEEVSSQINTILIDALNTAPDADGKVPGVLGAIEKLLAKLPTLKVIQATRIAVTETNQCTIATRDLLYRNAGYDEHRWLTVNDSRVRPAHSSNEAEGWIPMSNSFSSGESSPAEAIMCRCNKAYRRSERVQK